METAAIQSAPLLQAPIVFNTSDTTSIPLGNKPYTTPYLSLGAEICQNLYLEFAQSEFAKSQYYCIKIPGLKRFGALQPVNTGACRMLFTSKVASESSGRTFSVNGNTLFEILEDGTKTVIGNLETQEGVVSAADNGNLLMLVDGSYGYILRYSDNNFSKITDEYFPANVLGSVCPTHVDVIDTYFIINIPNTNTYYWSTPGYTSDLNDTSVPYDPGIANGYWNPLQSGQKIGKPDDITCLINCNNYLWIGGYNSIEVHYNSGEYPQVFKRYQGAIINVGCRAARSLAVYQNNIFFLGTDKAGTLGVFSNDGMNPVKISTRGIEQLIENMSRYDDCIGYTYFHMGHAFYVMQFPEASKTYVYDIGMQAWHERTKLDSLTGRYKRWDSVFATSNFDRLITGDLSTSEIYSLDANYYLNDEPLKPTYNYIRCVKTTPIGFQTGRQVRYNWIQVICNQGQGLPTNTQVGVGQDPSVQVAWSNDCGVTYGNERSAPLGRQGEYKKRSIVLSCGTSRNRVWRIAMSDPVPFLLVGVLVNSSIARY